MSIKDELEKEKDHSKFLERLIEAIYGEGWERLTLYEAKEWHKRHFEKPYINPWYDKL